MRHPVLSATLEVTLARKVFYSFHFGLDSSRAAQVKNIGKIEGSQVVSGNKWEEIKRAGDAAIKTWIASEMSGKKLPRGSCWKRNRTAPMG
jgi:hypothetical protein